MLQWLSKIKRMTVSPYFAFLLLHSLQIGVGVLGYQRVIAQYAGYDAWISLIVAGVCNSYRTVLYA